MAKALAPKHGGVHLAGIREYLSEGYAEEVRRGDPRVLPAFTEDWSSQEHREANAASPAIRQAQRMIERIDAGEDITALVPTAHRWPKVAGVSWYADPSVHRVVVSADDTVRPVYEN